MKLWSESFADGESIAGEYAFCVIDPVSHVKLSSNRNPHLAWSQPPAGAHSLALICHDVDVPSKADDLFRTDREIPADLPRVDFFHWVLIDIAANVRSIDAGAYSKEVTPRGKSGSSTALRTRQGLNDYTGWFASDHDMSGDYFGYDGPCPPWNDSIVHRYCFTLYALDVAALDLGHRFTGPDALKAIKGHVLAQAAITASYTLNPRLA